MTCLMIEEVREPRYLNERSNTFTYFVDGLTSLNGMKANTEYFLL